jgi:putative membrane protein
MRAFTTFTAIAAAALLSVPAFAADQKMDNADAAAMKQLAQANLNEVEAGKSAEAKAQNPQVKQFAQKMVTDHQQMYNELQSLAKQKGVALPQSASLKDMAEMKMAERASGAEFDKKYMDMMVKDHQKDAKEVADLVGKAKDPDFKSAVQKASAKINEHLQLAQRISSRTTASGASSTSGTPATSAAGSSSIPMTSPASPSGSAEMVNPHTNFGK